MIPGALGNPEDYDSSLDSTVADVKHKGGLGAVMSDANGFGVAWGMALLEGVHGLPGNRDAAGMNLGEWQQRLLRPFPHGL